MDLGSVNWIAVVVCVVLSMVVGFIWYHPRVFFQPWWRGIGKSASDTPDPSPTIYIWTALAALVEAVLVAMLVNALDSSSVGSGLQLGFLLWLGFVATTNLVNNLFGGRGWRVWAIEAGDHLVYLLLTGVILSVWR